MDVEDALGATVDVTARSGTQVPVSAAKSGTQVPGLQSGTHFGSGARLGLDSSDRPRTAQSAATQRQAPLFDSAINETVDMPASGEQAHPDESSIANTVGVVGFGGGAGTGDESLRAGASAGDSSGLLGAMAESLPERRSPPRSSPGAFPVANWDRYEFLELLGQGGMGSVYKARDRRLQRLVALKFIRGDDDRLSLRFMQEARAQARIDHPGICKVLEVGEVEGKAYIAMQFVDGKSLQQLRDGLTLTEKVQLIRDTALALHAAHELGIIHRDIKPANVMVERTPSGTLHPVVMDFGLARDVNESQGMTESGTVMGTAAFMSPEQARGESKRLDRRTDVYSLGATLFDLLAGKPPFVASSMADTLIKVIVEIAPPLRREKPGIPEALEIIVGKCLNKELEQRYQTADALAEDLDRFLHNQRIVGKRLSLYRLVRWKAQQNKPLAVLAVSLLLSVLMLVGYGVQARIQRARQARLAQELAAKQAELAQRLGQEIKDNEWLLRSARQMPVHNIDREKSIIRKRMDQIQKSLADYGALSAGLALYALGRGHMAMHEYTQALSELEQALAAGNSNPEVHYALGFVLGKHFEQAIYEARLAGGGDWAKKRLKDIEPRYLKPAIESLQRGRAMKLDSPRYLEGLIAFYQRDYAEAIRHAEAALQEAPWLYEASKLIGDIHVEQALQARDAGNYEAADHEFAVAVRYYTEAGDTGRSDAEIYDGLAEAWVRKIETSVTRGAPAEDAYRAAVVAADLIEKTDPGNIGGPLRKGYAALMTMGTLGTGLSSEERVQACQRNSARVLELKPGHPYASDLAAGCYAFAAEGAIAKGQDPIPLYQKALKILEPAVQSAPFFLWGLNDLATTYLTFGSYLELHGDPTANIYYDKALEYQKMTLKLDGAFSNGIQNNLYAFGRRIATAESMAVLKDMLARSDDAFGRCMAVNDKHQQCYINYSIIYARAAQRLAVAGLDARALVDKALEKLAAARKLGGSFLDLEQHTALAHVVDAMERLRSGQDPEPALTALEPSLSRCFSQGATDAMCRTLAAQGEWIRADQRLRAGQSATAALNAALTKATLATQSPETYPDAWYTLAQTLLRLARTATKSPVRTRWLDSAQDALQKLFAIHANHALGRLTEADLLLLRAKSLPEGDAKRRLAEQALASLDRVLRSDALLRGQVTRPRAEAEAIRGASVQPASEH